MLFSERSLNDVTHYEASGFEQTLLLEMSLSVFATCTFWFSFCFFIIYVPTPLPLPSSSPLVVMLYPSARQQLKTVGVALSLRMTEHSSDLWLGFGSFVDKPVSPYINVHPSKINNPCR